MKKLIACSYKVGNGDWEFCDEERWLGPNEAHHEEAREQVLEDVALDEGGEVEFRYEVWVDDSTWELAGEAVQWSVFFADVGEGDCADTAEEALAFINERGGGDISISRLVRIHTYGNFTVNVPAVPDLSSEEASV